MSSDNQTFLQNNVVASQNENPCGIRLPACPTWGSTADGEDGAKTRLAAQHALVSLGDALHGEDFIPRPHAGKRTEGERVLRIDGSPRIPAPHRQASSDETPRRNRE